jgi:predicted permease
MKFFRRQRFESEMDAEMRFHIDAFVEDLVRSGVERGEAERRARVEFGAIEAKKDECRQAWGLQWMDELRADLVFTLRTLRGAPGFAAVAILSLALGIGANTALFGVLDALLLRMLPVRDPGQLVFVQTAGTRGMNGGPPYPCFEILRDKAKSFAGMAAFSASSMEIRLNGVREQVRGLWASGNFYELLGVRPVIGRTLAASDDQTVGKGGPDGPVAVISRSYWEQRFGGDPAVIGRAVPMGEQTVTIVGVMPNEAMSVDPGRRFDMAAPMMLSDPVVLRQRGAWWLDIVARLRPGVRQEQAAAEANGLFQGFMGDSADSAEMRKLHFDHIELTAAGKGTDGLRTRFTTPLTALMVLAGLALVAACANVASLLLARASARQKEFAVRLAIGAARGRLVRQALTESLVLAGAGAGLGIGIAVAAQNALAGFFATGGDGIKIDLPLNVRLLFFTVAISAFTGLAFGLAPALRAANVNPAAGFQGGSRSVAGSRRGLRLGRVLVVLQVALSMMLLCGAGLFVRSLRQLAAVDRGFTREATLTMEVSPEGRMYGTPEWLRQQTEILERVRRMPGVKSAGWATMGPLSGRDRGVLIDIAGSAPRSITDRSIHLVSVSPEYFDAMGMKVLVGRGFSQRDNATSAKVAILNETAARFYFGSANPVGAKLRITIPRGSEYEIAGVIKDVKHSSLREEPGRFLYVPIPQSVDRINRVALAVRTAGDAGRLAAPIAREIRGMPGALLITNVATMEELAQRSMSRERLVAALSTVFGLLALVLAATGLYGILAYGVARRTNEIGIRMALGASTRGVTWMVLREALLLAGAGIAVGIPAVVAIGSFSRAMLYGVSAFDGAAFACAAVVLTVSAALAAVTPARRASRLDPMTALRTN